VVQVDGTLIEELDKAEQNQNVVIMVVDAWTLQVDSYFNYMRLYDGRTFVNCAVLVPWNMKDEDTAEKISTLQDRIRKAFARRIISKDPTCILDRISTAEDLESELKASLHKVRMRIMEYGEVGKPVDSGAPKPTISGPGGDEPDEPQ
jgi:FxsC-like protein